MLNKDNYVPWSSRLLRDAKSKPNRKLLVNFIKNGPCVRRMIHEPGNLNSIPPVAESTHEKTDDELTNKEVIKQSKPTWEFNNNISLYLFKIHNPFTTSYTMSKNNNNLQSQTLSSLHNAIMKAGDKDRPPMLAFATDVDAPPVTPGNDGTPQQQQPGEEVTLTGIDNDIYSAVDACPNAMKIWKAIERTLSAKQAEWRDDSDDELEDQELKAHYMYMEKIQEVTQYAAENTGPIFDVKPLKKVQVLCPVSACRHRIMEVKPDFENMTINEYLEYEAEMKRRLRNVQSRRSLTKYQEADFDSFHQDESNTSNYPYSRGLPPPHPCSLPVHYGLFSIYQYVNNINDLEKEEAQVEDGDDGDIYDSWDITVEYVERINEEAKCNPTEDMEELERLLAKDPQSYFTEIQELLPLKKRGRDQLSSSTSALPQEFKIGESSRKTSLKRHEEQIEKILNHLDELSLDRIENIKDNIE
nr:hypothetical protein [Tanacetum cinerariifolium]